MDKDLLRIDRKVFSVVLMSEIEKDLTYWLSKTPEERIEAVEFLRQLIFGYDPATERLQRVFETAEFKTS
jgi:hypothetical protein